MTKLQRWIIGLTGIILISLIAWIFWFVSQTTLTTQLGTLFNVLLTVFSVLLSLVISHYYFDSSRQSTIDSIKSDYQKNNKLYSQKAAEKVDNLSNELTKLSIYLQQSIDDDNNLNPVTALLVREEKIRSAIHIVETLKSINDKSLSDWLGVLDEEDIEEQNELREEKREERENDFRLILDNYRNFVTSDGGSIKYSPAPEGNEQLENVHIDLNELTKKIDKLATNIIGTPIKTRTNPIAKEHAKGFCPNCGIELSYRQRPTEASIKSFKCKGCSTRLTSHWNIQEGFQLSVKPVSISNPTPPKTLPEDVIKRVKAALPKQPWAKGTSQEIAQKLGISRNDMDRAIAELTSQGVFKIQIDGVLYDPIKKNAAKTRTRSLKKIDKEAAINESV
jgi:transcription initiation factor IIE alpha subunit